MKLTKCKTMSHFIRKSVLEGDIFVIDLQPFVDLQGLLYNATNNINQIARTVNQNHILTPSDCELLVQGIGQLIKEVESDFNIKCQQLKEFYGSH